MRSLRALKERPARLAPRQIPVLRPSTRGYKLANDGRYTRCSKLYLGRKNIMQTARYTEVSPERFKGFWED
jgi:hypothetical protein